MEAFQNRILKMYKHYAKWARKQGITCYRIYDDDVPEFPFSIDVYDKYLYICEYHRQHSMSEEMHEEWLRDCILLISGILEFPRTFIFMKERKQQSGAQQYEKTAEEKKFINIQEDGLTFKVNLKDYLDTGLFLDHRTTRSIIRAEAKDKRFLNLFAYTGSFTVYAAAGGASSSTTVDLSNTYLKWAEKNLIANELWSGKHEHIQADVKQWLPEQAPSQYDLAVLDPPTFSNSKRMKDVLDTQRDHVQLINDTLRLMVDGGVLYFSTNFRKFKLDEANLKASSIKNISGQTVPNDFRDKKIHQCWRMVK
jgi:23S rRNA (cytosine1962-C5)-methyltransferase